jgi:hypothetical protein
MEPPLKFEYDEVGDTLYINKVRAYPEQESEQLTYNVIARRNPHTGAIENLDVLFFTRWLLKGDQPKIGGLRGLFADPRTAARA